MKHNEYKEMKDYLFIVYQSQNVISFVYFSLCLAYKKTSSTTKKNVIYQKMLSKYAQLQSLDTLTFSAIEGYINH